MRLAASLLGDLGVFSVIGYEWFAGLGDQSLAMRHLHAMFGCLGKFVAKSH